jgi:hypothetical protein
VGLVGLLLLHPLRTKEKFKRELYRNNVEKTHETNETLTSVEGANAIRKPPLTETANEATT